MVQPHKGVRFHPAAGRRELIDLAGGQEPVLLCYERAGTGQWCHRAMAAEWLAKALGEQVPEVGFETLAQAEQPAHAFVSSEPPGRSI